MYYVWVKDSDGNYTSTEIKIYDLSKDTAPNTVIGIVKDVDGDGEYTLSIEGQGSTKDLTSTEDKPWESEIENITKIEVDEGVTGIGENVLAELENVDKIEISSTVTDIALDAFAGTNNYSEITVEGDNFKVTDGMLFDADEENLYIASTKVTTGDVVLPDSIQNIAPYTFANSTITSITIPNNIDINEGTFYNAQDLEEIIAGDGEIGGEYIGDKAFYNTTKLTDITISKDVTTLGGNEIFTNIGTEAGTDTGKGYVYYYDSNEAMSNYAQNETTKDQATFVGIDDVLPVVSGVDINNGAEITNNNEQQQITKV